MSASNIFEGIVRALPAKGLKGEMRVPGDKSISHRSVFFGSIAEGTTEVTGFLEGEDNLSTISAFRLMGVDIIRDGDRVTIKGKGFNGLLEPSDIIDAYSAREFLSTKLKHVAGRKTSQGS